MPSALDTLFSSSARVQVLSLFLLNPGRAFYQREIERELGQPIRAVQREVERLESIGLLLRSAEGNRVFYRVNPGFPLLPELVALFQKGGGFERAAEADTGQAVSVPSAPALRQPFAWMETPQQAPSPSALRRMQLEGEWDRAF